MSARTKRVPHRIAVITITWLVVLGTIPVGTAAAGPVLIDSCTVIDQPGSYALSADIVDSNDPVCIDIRSSDVVLDGAGHVIDGRHGRPTTGISAANGTDPLSNVTVRNLEVTDWDRGIHYARVNDGGIANVDVWSNQFGIVLGASHSNRVAGNNVSNNHNGVVLTHSTNNALEGNSADNNSFRGIHAHSESNDNTYENNVVSNNTVGITVTKSRRNSIAGNLVTANSIGIDLVLSFESDVLANQVESNADLGIHLDRTVNDRVTNNTVIGNGDGGIETFRSIGAEIDNNSVRSNVAFGVHLLESRENVVEENFVWANTRGLFATDSRRNRLSSNTIVRNAFYGIRFRNSSNNSVSNNLITDTAGVSLGFGIALGERSTGNTIADNRVTDSAIHGIVLIESSDNELEDNVVLRSDQNGIEVGLRSDNTTLRRNSADENGLSGFVIDWHNTTLKNNSASDNRWRGFEITGRDHHITNSTAKDNNNAGISLASVHDSVVRHTNATSNRFDGLAIFASSRNLVEDTHVSGNRIGIFLVSSTDNTIRRTVARDNDLHPYQSVQDSNNNTVIDLTFNPTVSFRGKDVSIHSIAPSSRPADPTDLHNISQYVAVSNNSADSWLFLNVSYTHDDLNASGVNESTLRLWRHVHEWSAVPGTNGVNAVENEVFANITEFTASSSELYVPVGELGESGAVISDTTITSVPTTVDEPGTYRLESSFECAPEDGYCLAIRTRDAMLRGIGHAISLVPDISDFFTIAPMPGPGARYYSVDTRMLVSSGSSETVGVLVGSTMPLENDSIQNLSVAGFDTGVRYVDTTGGSVTDVNVSNNGVGLTFVNSSDIVVENLTAENNTDWAFRSAGGSTNITAVNVTINPTLSFHGRDVAIRAVGSPPADPAGLRSVGPFVNATNTSSRSWLFLNVSYAEMDVESAGVDESTLRLWRYNGTWTEVGGTNGVNTVDNYVFANITEFSTFAILGSPSSVPPTVDAGEDVVADEGSIVSVTASFADTNPGDVHTATIDWGDGTVESGIVDQSGQTVAGSHTYADDGSFVVTVEVCDSAGNCATDELNVDVNNLPPTADAGGPYGVDEGATIILVGSGTDPAGAADPLTFTWDLDGDGSFDDAVGYTPTFVAGDGPDSGKVHLRVVDDDGGAATDDATVTVSNLPPIVSADRPVVSVQEGQVATQTGIVSDPGRDEVSLEASVGTVSDHGDGTWTWSFETLDGPGDSQSVTVTATDDDGAERSTTFDLSVSNVPPTAAVVGDGIEEGGAATIRLAIDDPGLGDSHTAEIDWGYGSAEPTTVTIPAGTDSVEVDHDFGDDGNYPVTVTVVDDDGGEGMAESVVEVTNVVPDISLASAGGVDLPTGEFVFLGRIDRPQTHTASATDSGSDDLTFIWTSGPTTVYYNDGNGPDAPRSAGGQFPFSAADTASVTFSDPGIYDVGVTVIDDDGGQTESVGSKIVTGDATRIRGVGFWRHQFSGRGNQHHPSDDLAAFLEIANRGSAVFSEAVTATDTATAHDVLTVGGPGTSVRAVAEAQLLASWLNFAAGGVGWHDLIDTDGDGEGDAPFYAVIAEAEALLLDPDATREDIERAKDLAEAINGGSSTSDTESGDGSGPPPGRGNGGRS